MTFDPQAWRDSHPTTLTDRQRVRLLARLNRRDPGLWGDRPYTTIREQNDSFDRNEAADEHEKDQRK